MKTTPRATFTGPRFTAAACVLLAVAAFGCASSGHRGAERAAEPIALTILTTNDFHGALEQIDTDRSSGRPIGGAAYVASTIDRERGGRPDQTLVVDAGDIYQGTALSNLTMGKASIEYMNDAGFEAAAIGNHEFDWGVGTLLDRIEQANFAMLCANVVDKKTRKAPGWAKPYVVIEKSGVRIAVIGLITPDTPMVTMPKNVEAYDFLDPAPVANALIKKLVPAEADLAILVAHIGGSQDSSGAIRGEMADMATAVVGEAAVVGGHTHQRVAGKIDGVPVVEAGASGRYLGRIDLAVDPRSLTVLGSEVRLVTVFADSIAPDPIVATMVERSRRAVAPLLDEVLAEAADTLEAERRECALGNLMSDVMRWKARASFSFQNPGGVRAPIPPGPITLSEVYRLMPFDNTIVVVNLTGMEVIRLLEQAASDGGFLHVSGLHYSLDMSKPAWSRVTTASIEGGREIIADTVYPVAVNSFMAQGGDELSMLEEAKDKTETGVLVRDAIVEWLRAESSAGRPIDPKPEGRIFITGRAAR